MKISKILTSALAALLILPACEETSNIGSSLVEDTLAIEIDSSFTVSGKSVALEGVRSRTTNQILGAVDIPGYGRLSSNVVTQFLPSTQLNTEDYSAEDVDSLILMLRYNRGAFFGDSVAPMALTVYPLTRQLPSPIYSNFSPDGYYDPSVTLASKVYNTSTLDADSLGRLAYGYIAVNLPQEFGRKLFKSYQDNPASYATPSAFAKDVFPGMYIAGTYGSGRMTIVSMTTMRMFMSTIKENKETNKKDTLRSVQDYYMVTPEVISNNNFSYTMAPSLKKLADEGTPVMVAPIGYETEIKFPAREIAAAYNKNNTSLKVVNGLSLEIPIDSIPNGFGVSPPPYALLVMEEHRDSFFANNELPDNIHSFYATYNASSMSYSFNDMRSYITELLSKDEITEKDCTFRLVPVLVNFESLSSSYGQQQKVESSVVPYVSSPAMAKILLDKAKIKFTYSLQNQK